MPRWRLGVALLIPEPFATEINGLRRALGDGSLARIPAHITLVPPVNVRVDTVPAALRLLREACAATSPFVLRLGPVTTFAPDTPVIKLDIGDDGLAALQRLRDAVFVPPLERSLTWPFVPHVTLADEAEDDRISAALRALADYEIEVPFDRLHLLREEVGREWIPVADFSFGPLAVIGRGGMPLEMSVTHMTDPEALEVLESDPGPTDLVVTARRDGAVVGVMAGRVETRDAVIAAVTVAPEARGQGIGAHLLATFGSAASKRDCTRMVVDIERCSDRAAFFRQQGFVDSVKPL